MALNYLFIMTCIFTFSHSLKIDFIKDGIKYTQATCKHYCHGHEDNSPYKDLIHPFHIAPMTRLEMREFLKQINPSLSYAIIDLYINKLIEDGFDKLIAEGSKDNSKDLDIDKLIDDNKNNSTNNGSSTNNSNGGSSSSSSNNQTGGSTANNQTGGSSSSSSNNSTGGSSTNNQTGGSSSSNSNNSTGGSTTNNQTGGSSTNNQPKKEITNKAGLDKALVLKDNIELQNLVSNTPNEKKELYGIFEAVEPLENNFYTSEFVSKVIIPDETTNAPIEIISNPTQNEFNQERDASGWIFSGKMGTSVKSSGVVKCSNGFIDIYVLVPQNVSILTTDIVVPLLGELLDFWNMSEINCYTNTVSIPMVVVAEENEVIEESNYPRLCFYGRVTNNSEGVKVLIRSNFFELAANNTIACSYTTLFSILTNRFKLQNYNYEGMNSCYCGVLGK